MENYEKYEERRLKILRKKSILGEWVSGIDYAGTSLLSSKAGNQRIKELLMLGKPVTISRFGKTEMDPVMYRELGRNDPDLKQRVDRSIGNCSGFFPCTSEMIDRYREVFIESINDIDYLGIWFFIENEEYIIDKYMEKPICALPGSLDAFNFKEPWTVSLKGKKVLVINPFSETIKSQYERRDKLFKNQKILPEFELKTLKSVQTLADERDSRFENWFEALEWMKSEISAIDFDVALLGCGAYGIPLQHYIKKIGKSSVYMGGGVQLLFGIKGRRFDQMKRIRKLYNDYWVRPSETEQIKSWKKVEMGGPYW